MSRLPQLRKPPWRTFGGAGLAVLLVLGSYSLWSPGLDVRDGRHDRHHNGIWIGHGWLGGDAWFRRNGKLDEIGRFRDPGAIQTLADWLGRHHITDVFPHLCPAEASGLLPALDHAQAERFLDGMSAFRILPWIGGVAGVQVHLADAQWRASFCAAVRALMDAHPRFAGVHLNVEPLASGDANFLRLLEELRGALPEDKLLSVAAYPPPTRWHPFPEVHWSAGYFRQVARRCDQMAVMMYDTALLLPKLYQNLLARWTEEVLAWSGKTDVLLGLPTYADAGTGYHHPGVENLENGLLGVHRGLARRPVPSNYQGVVVYSYWETDSREWALLRERFLR